MLLFLLFRHFDNSVSRPFPASGLPGHIQYVLRSFRLLQTKENLEGEAYRTVRRPLSIVKETEHIFSGKGNKLFLNKKKDMLQTKINLGRRGPKLLPNIRDLPPNQLFSHLVH
jgi:hypothetical protein